jgi:hypothetical protein
MAKCRPSARTATPENRPPSRAAHSLPESPRKRSLLCRTSDTGRWAAARPASAKFKAHYDQI